MDRFTRRRHKWKILKNMTTVARNLFQARQQYTASTDWLPEMKKRMDNVINSKLVEGEALATQACPAT